MGGYGIGEMMSKPGSKDKIPFQSGTMRESMQALRMCMRGVPLIRSGRMQDAMDVFDEAIDIDPNNSCSWFNKGYVLSAEGCYDEALEVFEEAITAEPSSAPPWIGKAYMLTAAARYEEALEAFEWAIKLDPVLPDPWNGKGNALVGLARYEEAFEAFDAASAIDPRFAHPWYGKALVLEQALGLAASAGYTVEQCLCRVYYLMKKYTQQFPVSKPFLLDMLGRVSLPLLAQELIAGDGAGAEETHLIVEKTGSDYEIPLVILSAIDASGELDVVDKSLWSGIINYYFGNPVRALDFLDIVDSNDETNMAGQYYLLRSLLACLEPSEKETAFALKQAEAVLAGSLSRDYEQRYYAGQIFLMAGREDDAKKCFVGNVQYIPALYMHWLCLNKKNDTAAHNVLKKVFIEELRLIKGDERGFLAGGHSLEPGVVGPDLIKMIQGYAYSKEIESAVEKVKQQNNLMRFAEYQDLAMHMGQQGGKSM